MNIGFVMFYVFFIHFHLNRGYFIEIQSQEYSFLIFVMYIYRLWIFYIGKLKIKAKLITFLTGQKVLFLFFIKF